MNESMFASAVLSLTALQRRCLHLRADGLCNRETYCSHSPATRASGSRCPSAKSMPAFSSRCETQSGDPRQMKLTKTVIAGSVLVATALSSVGRGQSQQQAVKNIVLVHGAFADGTSWA